MADFAPEGEWNRIEFMPDVMTRDQRSRCMASIRSKDTRPEMIVRRLVFGLGYRYRLHVRSLPGTPDMVFSSRRKIINISGCFWHMHGCGRSRVPASRRKYWVKKLMANKIRDRRNQRALWRRGWKVITVWECRIGDLRGLARRIEKFLKS